MHMVSGIRAMVLAVVGFLLGTLGVSLYANSQGLPGFLQSLTATKQSHASLANACVPVSTDDDIFFISCGGIY